MKTSIFISDIGSSWYPLAISLVDKLTRDRLHLVDRNENIGDGISDKTTFRKFTQTVTLSGEYSQRLSCLIPFRRTSAEDLRLRIVLSPWKIRGRFENHSRTKTSHEPAKSACQGYPLLSTCGQLWMSVTNPQIVGRFFNP